MNKARVKKTTRSRPAKRSQSGRPIANGKINNSEPAMYDYVKRSYGVDPKVGQKVRHTVTNRSGVIAHEGRTNQHYVRVKFDGDRVAMNCHPTELDYQ